ncbi:MAG: glutaminase, partial [Cyanobacteria bacterium]|nr:glutaminase [Cyanobacteriota bacterium]
MFPPETAKKNLEKILFDSFDLEKVLFESLDLENIGYIKQNEMIAAFTQMGILQDDPRFKEMFQALNQMNQDKVLYFQDFAALIQSNILMIEKVLQSNLIIPDFKQFCDEIKEIFESTAGNLSGKVADYIPQLKRVPPDQYGVSLCTIDGQRFSLGDSDKYFCVQSASKPINYCLALEEHGEALVHKHIGQEPSGKGFNELTLNEEGLPHNPMINAGAIMCCALVKKGQDIADRFEHVLEMWSKMAGGERAGFNNSVYLSERQTADRNFALGYFMREKNAFPANTNLVEILEFYFQCCSIEVTTQIMSIIAGTLANGGICPLTGERILQPNTVKNCLSLMSSCGMYDFSGEFAFRIGLPAKSGVS